MTNNMDAIRTVQKLSSIIGDDELFIGSNVKFFIIFEYSMSGFELYISRHRVECTFGGEFDGNISQFTHKESITAQINFK